MKKLNAKIALAAYVFAEQSLADGYQDRTVSAELYCEGSEASCDILDAIENELGNAVACEAIHRTIDL